MYTSDATLLAMDAIKSMFSNSKAKANVSPDGGAPDTVGTAVAHTHAVMQKRSAAPRAGRLAGRARAKGK